MAQMAALRRIFAEVKLNSDASSEESGSGKQVVADALDRSLPVRVNCHNVHDIHNAIALARAFNLDLVLEGATEAYRAIDVVKESETPVVLTGAVSPGRRDPRDYTRDVALGRIDPTSPAVLAEAGIKFALSAPTDETVADLRFVAAHAITEGLSPDQALKAITIVPAEILGVADRVGSIERGKDADLVVLTDEPFRVHTTVDRTIIHGQTVYLRGPDEPNAPERPTLAIRAGRILTASQGQVDDGLILVRESTISYVGPSKDVPEGTPLVDAGDSVVIPGMIDIHSHLGLHWDSEPVGLNQSPATTGPDSNRLRLVSIVNALVPEDAAFEEARRRGVTSILLAPATTGLVSGNAAVIKTAGDDVEDVVVKEYAAVKFSMLGNAGRRARIWQARSLLKKAKEYAEKWDRYEREHREYEHRQAAATDDEIEEPKRPGRDTNLELLRGLFKRKMPAVVHAARADEIRNALKVFRDEYNLDVIILGGDDSSKMIRELKEFRADLAIGPDILQYDKGRPVNNGDILTRHGLRVAFHTSATSGTQYLPVNAAYAVRHGMDKNKALRAVTSYPAQMLNLDDRLGSIDTGKDADLVILSGEPFEFTSRVEKVIVNGKVVFDSTE
jgi:imidazolonepropionase-like amidohydrolase